MQCNTVPLEKERFPFIDGLRGSAILLVILHHGFYFFVMPTMGPSLNLHGLGKLFFILARGGFYGVHLFFVLSGFLITGLLMGFINGQLDISRFYFQRCFKILPLYYFIVISVFLSVLSFSQVSALAWKIAPYLFFFQNYGAGVPWLDHTWSIVVEEQFYIFWALFLSILSKHLCATEKRWRAAILGATLIVVLTTINRFFLFNYGVSLVYLTPMETHMTHATSVIADGLMLGCILRLIWFRYPKFFKNKKTSYFFYISGFFTFLLLLVHPLKAWGVPGFWHSVNLAWLSSILFIMAGLGGATWFLSNSWLRWTGRNSYGIYLIHYPLALLFNSRFSGAGYLILIIYVLLAVSLGSLATATIEKYFLDIRKRIIP